MNATASKTFDEELERLYAAAPDSLANASRLYNELRETAPVYEFRGIALVSRYDDGKLVIRDAERFSNTKGADSHQGRAFRESLTPEQRPAFDEVAAIEARWLTRVGGDEHLRLRSAAHRAFTPRRIAELEIATRSYVDAMLAELPRENDVVDLMPLADGVPLMIVGDLLGAPAGDREQIHSWSRRIAGNLGTYQVETLLDAHAAYREFSAYVDSLVVGHRGRSGESTDLVSALVGAEAEQRLTTQDLVSMFIVLLFAGHETTSNLISIGLYELLRRRDEWAQLTADPTLAAAAVEELLRFVSPVQWNLRQATADVDVHGVRIRAGQDVQVILASANRDPEVFTRPDELDLDRPDAAQHIAFGYGAHFCLGSALARLEGRIVLGTLAARYPELALATENLEWTGTANLRRLRALPVRLGAR